MNISEKGHLLTFGKGEEDEFLLLEKGFTAVKKCARKKGRLYLSRCGLRE